MEPREPNSFFHIKALLLGLALVVLALLLAVPFAKWVERPYLRALLADPFDEKDQGTVLQREAFLRSDVLPVYGSSEQRSPTDMRAGVVFAHERTGFQVCPVGAKGDTTLMMAQKIAAQGAAVRGHKVAFILSSTWFRRPTVPSSQIAGTFSPLQDITFLQAGELDPALRQRFVTRLLSQLDALNDQPMIARYLLSTTTPAPGWSAAAERRWQSLVLWLYGARLTFEDHENMLERLLTQHSLFTSWVWKAQPEDMPWQQLIDQKEKETDLHRATWVKQKVLRPPGDDDAEILALMKNAREWNDFALLLDTLKSLGAKALIISVPLPGWFMDPHGISRSCRDYYYHRIEAMSAARGYPAATFSEHDQDRDFLEGVGTHLEAKGWLYVDRLLDDFYHDRLPPSQKST